MQLVRDPSIDTLAPLGVEKIIWQRISGSAFMLILLVILTYCLCSYPAAIKNHVHVTKAHLPIDIVKALSAYPSLVQKAVEAFYTRDAAQLRVRSTISHNLSHPTTELNI